MKICFKSWLYSKHIYIFLRGKRNSQEPTQNPKEATGIQLFILPSLLSSSLQEYQGLVTYKLYKGVEKLRNTLLNSDNKNTWKIVERY